MRDRDELAAALEVRDRIKYDLSTPEREEILSTGDLIVEVMFCKTDFEDNNGSFPNQSLFFNTWPSQNHSVSSWCSFVRSNFI